MTERDTRRVLRVTPDGEVTELGIIESATPQGEAGLLGVALSPDFENDRTAYFYVSTAADNRVVRAELDGDRLGAAEPILTGIPNGFIHDGGRLEFGPDGYLYVSTGETGTPSLAQDRDSLRRQDPADHHRRRAGAGQPVRLTRCGRWGHRNVQGLAFDDDAALGLGVRRRTPSTSST